MQLKWIWPIAALNVFSFCPTQLGGLKFIPIYEALTIRAQKTAPPYIAFEETYLHTQAQKNRQDDWSRLEKTPATSLVAEVSSARPSPNRRNVVPVPTQKVVLKELVITKQVETIYTDLSSDDWKEGLSEKQQARLIEAQAKNRVLDQDWSLPTWSDEVEKQLASAGYTKTGSKFVAPHSSPTAQKVYISATDAKGQNHFEIPQASVNSNDNVTNVNASVLYEGNGDTVMTATSAKAISGPLEITGGLAITNEHYIEIRRTNEGVAREVGRVDLQKGTYSINVDEPSGSIDAKLVNKEGKILGEGSVRLARLDLNRQEILGPKLKIEPHANFSGLVSNYQANRAENTAPAKTVATLMRGVEEISVKKDGNVSMEKMAKGSSTVLRAAAPKYMQTASVVFSGEEFNAPLFPTSMINALKEIVLNEKQDISKDQGLGAVVWGTVSLDGKPVSGIQVRLESDEGKIPVYFDQFMLPNPKLTATSENGLYAFIDVEEGFQSLLATRGDNIFGYQNVVAENGSVALGNIENSIKIESVPLRVFDAFNGVPLSARVTLQSIDHEVEVFNGSQVLLLPNVSRLGLIRVTPENNEYLPARYLYNDKDAYVHLPMISWSWLSNIKTYLKLSDQTRVGVVVGFVPDEDFEVFLAGYDDFDTKNVVYFDVQGRILQTGKGISGGGFIIYNVPEDTHEVVVVGAKTQKIYSKVLPVDGDTLSILSFRE